MSFEIDVLFIHKKKKSNLVWFRLKIVRSSVFDSKSILLLKSHVSFKRHLCSNLHSEVHLQWMQVYFVWTAVCPLDSLQRNLTCIILWEVMTDKWFQQLFHVSGEDGKKKNVCEICVNDFRDRHIGWLEIWSQSLSRAIYIYWSFLGEWHLLIWI